MLSSHQRCWTVLFSLYFCNFFFSSCQILFIKFFWKSFSSFSHEVTDIAHAIFNIQCPISNISLLYEWIDCFVFITKWRHRVDDNGKILLCARIVISLTFPLVRQWKKTRHIRERCDLLMFLSAGHEGI